MCPCSDPGTPTVCPSPSLGISMSSPQQYIAATPTIAVTSNSTFVASTPAQARTPCDTPHRRPHSPLLRSSTTPPQANSTPSGKITDFVRSTKETLRSKFEYPGKTKMASSSTISLSQLQNLTSSISAVKEQSSTTDTDVVSKQLVSPVVIILDDSLEETIHNTPPVIKQEVKLKEDTGANPSPLYPVGEESPVLFDTPSSVGREPLIAKLAKRALSKDGGPNQPLMVDVSKNNPPSSENFNTSPCKMEYQLEDTLKCEVTAESTVLSDVPSDDQTTDDIDTTPPLPQQKPRTPPGTVKNKLKDGAMGGATPNRGMVDLDLSPMDQPRTRRSNVRLASKRGVDSEKTPLSSEVMEVADDVKPLKEKWIVVRVCVCTANYSYMYNYIVRLQCILKGHNFSPIMSF